MSAFNPNRRRKRFVLSHARANAADYLSLLPVGSEARARHNHTVQRALDPVHEWGGRYGEEPKIVRDILGLGKMIGT